MRHAAPVQESLDTATANSVSHVTSFREAGTWRRRLAAPSVACSKHVRLVPIAHADSPRPIGIGGR